MQLRKYQNDALSKIKSAYDKGVNKQVLVLATGLGKTIVFSKLISDLVKKTNKKALIIAHREELLTQARDKLLRLDPSLKIGIEQATNYAPDDSDVVIASVPTLGRINSTRLGRFDPSDFCVAVVDEAHHSSADTYKQVFRKLGVLKEEPTNDWNKKLLLLGVTATPSRNDNKGIDKIFDNVVYEFGIVAGIREGWLSRIKAYRVDTTTDLTAVHKTAGDFNLGELGEAVNNQDRNGLIVSAYKRIVPGKQALCFAVDVDHAMSLAKRFAEEGVKTGFVTGALPKDERRDTLLKFSQKQLQVLVNCMVLTEGYDEPTIEAVLMARPTQSGILFQQMIGRGTRILEGKEGLTIIDFVDNTYRQNLQTTCSLLGMEGKLDFQGLDILEVKEELDQLLELAPGVNLDKLDVKKIKYAIEEVDILSGLKIPDEISPHTTFDWHRYGDETYRIGLSGAKCLILKKNLTGQFVLTGVAYDKDTKKEVSQVLGQWNTIEGGIQAADHLIRVKFPDVVKLVSNTAKWRNEPLSDKQQELLQKFRINPTVIQALNRGQGSKLITKLINNSRQELVKPWMQKGVTINV